MTLAQNVQKGGSILSFANSRGSGPGPPPPPPLSRSAHACTYSRHVNTLNWLSKQIITSPTQTPSKLATLCVYVVNYNGQSTTTVHGFLTCCHILNNCYFIVHVTGKPFSENLNILHNGITDGIKAPCITGTSTFKTFHICMCFGIHTICLKITLV